MFHCPSRPAPLKRLFSAALLALGLTTTAAALAADVHELLESMARKRVPRLEAVRRRVRNARGGMAVGELETALHALHAATEGLNLLAARSAERVPDFLGGNAPYLACQRQARVDAKALMGANSGRSPRASDAL